LPVECDRRREWELCISSIRGVGEGCGGAFDSDDDSGFDGQSSSGEGAVTSQMAAQRVALHS